MTRYGRSWRALAAGVALAAATGPAIAGPFPTTYDRLIRATWERHMPQESWVWGRAQWWQESRLDPKAVSPVGAAGLTQVMPATWKQETRLMSLGLVDPHMVEPSLQVGAAYMAKMRKTWKARRPEGSRRKLAQSSYNAGAGSLIRAQTKCTRANRSPRLYRRIVKCLPQVTGRYSAETITYVSRIRKWFLMMQ